jgi:GMP synthase-like glutamine amidotransferase
MRVHYLQHAECDGPGSIRQILKSRGHTLTSTRLHLDETLPEIEEFDWLIILGGEMGVYDEAAFPWLVREKSFIKDTIKADKIILGICLGSQLIANVLGAKIRKNQYKEIGWFPITPLEVIKKTILSDVITGKPEVFHWHEDTAELPDGSLLIAGSDACPNQGFIHDNKIVGLQFHPEITKEAADAFFCDCDQNIEKGPYVQSPDRILSNDQGFAQSSQIMAAVLKAMERQSILFDIYHLSST